MSLDARLRMRALLDCLAILAELPTYEDAAKVCAALHHLDTFNHLVAMFRPCELPATTRQNLAEAASEPRTEETER